MRILRVCKRRGFHEATCSSFEAPEGRQIETIRDIFAARYHPETSKRFFADYKKNEVRFEPIRKAGGPFGTLVSSRNGY